MRTIKLWRERAGSAGYRHRMYADQPLDKTEAERFIRTALEEGANFFDHADIYGEGTCEELFADAIGMNDDLRETIILQSKCGIRKGSSISPSSIFYNRWTGF